MAREVLEEEAAKDAMAGKVNEAFKKFRARVGVWGSLSEIACYNVIADIVLNWPNWKFNFFRAPNAFFYSYFPLPFAGLATLVPRALSKLPARPRFF